MLNWSGRQSTLIFGQAPADVPELRAGDDRLHRHAEPVVAGLQSLLHFFEQQQVGQRHLAAKLLLEPGMRVLDYCAGGGGKALAMAAR